jgi:hypothetical protein
MMTPKYLYCLTISMSCLPIWKVFCCFELVEGNYFCFGGEKKRHISLALDVVVLRAVCSFFVRPWAE